VAQNEMPLELLPAATREEISMRMKYPAPVVAKD
jgi:hypothetical protein